MTPRISSPAAARLFLLGLALVGTGTAWVGVRPDDFSFLPCPSRLLAGVACPGCGMTRAFLALFRGDFAAAWSFNPFFPALAATLAAAAFLPAGPRRRLAGLGERAAPLALALALLLWVQRLGWSVW